MDWMALARLVARVVLMILAGLQEDPATRSALMGAAVAMPSGGVSTVRSDR